MSIFCRPPHAQLMFEVYDSFLSALFSNEPLLVFSVLFLTYGEPDSAAAGALLKLP